MLHLAMVPIQSRSRGSSVTFYAKQKVEVRKSATYWRDKTRKKNVRLLPVRLQISRPSVGPKFANLVTEIKFVNKHGVELAMNNNSDVDRLSVFLEKVAAEAEDEALRDDENYVLRRIKVVLQSVFQFAFKSDPKFGATFEQPPEDLGKYDGIDTLVKTNTDNYKCRLFLKKFTHPGSFEVSTGAQADLPPGAALCRVSDKATSEERTVINKQWVLCLDQDGYLSPQLMFPWFANVFVRAVKCLAEPGADDDDDDEPESEEEWKRKAESNPWLGIHAYADFPSVHLLLPKRRRRRQERQKGEGEGEGEGEDVKDGQERERPPLTHDGASDAGDQVGEDKPSEPDDDERSFTSGDGIEPAFTTVTITPCVEGFGWLKGVKLQHALPKTRPYADRGLRSLADFMEKLEDGQPMWFLEASPSDFSASAASLSPRFKSTFRRVGSGGCFWNLSLAPTAALLEAHMVSACRDAEFSFDLEKLTAAILVVKKYHKWDCLSPEVVRHAVLWTAKRHLANLKTMGTCFLKVMTYLKHVARSRSCPNFLLPNVNIAAGMDLMDARRVVSDVAKMEEAIAEDEANVLKYIGYEKKGKKKRNKKYDVGQ